MTVPYAYLKKQRPIIKKAGATTGNVTGKAWRVDELVGSPEFRQGMADFHAKVWRQELADFTFRYERGRQFAAVTGLRKVQVTPTGYAYKKFCDMFVKLFDDKSIC